MDLDRIGRARTGLSYMYALLGDWWWLELTEHVHIEFAT